MAAPKNKNKKKKNKKTKKRGFKSFIISLFILLIMALFRPTTVILLVGMLPTFVAYLVDSSLEKNKTFTVGAMNFAGCFPYLLGLWTGEHTLLSSLTYLENPQTIIIIYSIAAMGYLINYVTTLVVSSIMAQKSKMRIERIGKSKRELEKRWGPKVSGKYNSGNDGRAVQSADGAPVEAS
jgi:hypothetical protein